MQSDCFTCQYNQDPHKAPGGWIKAYHHWILEHVNEPIPVLGWLVLKTKRHTEGITGMNTDEAQELGSILKTIPKLQKELCQAAQIYVVCFTEDVAHLHIHLIPRHKHEEKKGPELFALMDAVRKDLTQAVPISCAIHLVDKLKKIIG